MIRAFVADDDRGSLGLLRRALGATGKVEIVAEASDGLECLKLLFREPPDVLFLDIEMPLLTGIEVAEEALRLAEPPLVVFITNHDEHAVRAFQLAAMDYIVKDMRVAEFHERVAQAVDRVERALANRLHARELQHADLALLAERTTKGQSAPDSPLHGRLPVKDHTEGTIRFLKPEDILCVERRDKRTEVRTREGKFPTYCTMDALLKRLAPHGFARASRSVLVNLDHVEHMIPNGDGTYDIILEGLAGLTVAVSRSNARDLLAALTK
jgi:DNA-binding LytR/AlgR family response regulator